MQKSNEDCFYFLTSTCAKGSACSYRHNPTVLTCNVICPAWSSGNCTNFACPLRHSTIQRPTINIGKTCFYETTPMGCLKLDCTFGHLRPRPGLRNSPTPRPSTTNLVNKEVIKPPPASPVINPSINEPVPTPQIIPCQLPIPKVEIPSVPETPVSTKPEQPINYNSVVEDSSEKNLDDIKTSTRVVVNRNIVIAEPNRNVVIAESNRNVVQGTISNRVVVSSEKTTHDSDSDLDDLIEQENDTKRTNTSIDISFPCSAPSITNRLFMSSKPSIPSTNDTKPIRLNRDRLPAAKIPSPNIIPTSTNGEKTSAGTGLSQDDDRRTNRIQRFKKKPISPPRSVVNSSSSSSIPTRNVIKSSPNERKRPASEQIINGSPASKRLSSQPETNHHHNSATIGDLCSPPPSPPRRTHTRHHRRRRSSPSPSPSSSPSPPPIPQRKSPLRQTYSTTTTTTTTKTSSMNDSTWKKEVDEFLAKTTQPKLVPLLSLRPRFIPPLLQPQSRLPPPLMPRHYRPRQPPPAAIKRPPLAPVITPPEVSIKPAEPIASSPTPSSTNSKDEDENRLLGLNDPTDVIINDSTDVVNTFAAIDEILLETDDFFELM